AAAAAPAAAAAGGAVRPGPRQAPAPAARPGNNPFAPSQGMPRQGERPGANRSGGPRPGNNPFAPSQGMPRPGDRDRRPAPVDGAPVASAGERPGGPRP